MCDSAAKLKNVASRCTLSVKVLLLHFSASECHFLSGSKENKPKDAEGPARKRRRIILMDSDDDSGDDATFKPKKEVGGYELF